MSTPMPTDELAARVRTMQIILGAIVAGAVLFLAVVSLMRAQSEQPTPEPGTLTYVMLGIAFVMAVGYHFANDAVTRGQRQRIAAAIAAGAGATDVRRMWHGAYQASLIAGAAVLEAAAFALILAYYLEGHWYSRTTAIGFILVMAIMLFPTAPGVERWIREQEGLIVKER